MTITSMLSATLNEKVNVIYGRFSSDLQRPESNADQERRCRDDLTRRGLSNLTFIVIVDEALPGALESRPGLDKIKDLIDSGRLGILIVTEQSRLTRGDNAMSLIKNIVYQGGRFISVSEGVDTAKKGWEMQVGIYGIHHSHSTKDTAERVRGGQEGRVLDGNGSAGDFPYGYRSDYIDPQAAQAYRGPKPKKEVLIDDVTAAIVVAIFARFVAGESIGSMVRWLNNTPTIPRIGKSPWHHEHVRRILKNQKYIGLWIFGMTTTIYNDQGESKQVPARDDQRVTRVERPDLRIITVEIWDAAQARLAKLLQIYGMKPEGKKRGPTEYYRDLYPNRLLNGKVICLACQSKLHDSSSSNDTKRMGCPKHKAGLCAMASHVPVLVAEQAILSLLQKVLSSYPDWLEATVNAMRSTLEQKFKEIPTERETLAVQLRKIECEITNLLDLAAQGAKGPSLNSRLDKLETDKSQIKSQLDQLGKLRISDNELPTEEWVHEQLLKMAVLLTKDQPGGIKALRDAISDITAEEMIAPGKKRGYLRLHFRLHAWAILYPFLASRLPNSVLSLVAPPAGSGAQSEEFVIDLGAPTNMDRWAPQIAQWRKEGVKWVEICRRTGLKLANASLAYKRFCDGGGKAA